MKNVRVISTGEIVEIHVPYIVVKDGYLYNKNTKKNEAISGDIVEYNDEQFIVSKGQYTNYQVIPYKREDGIKAIKIFGATDARNKIIVHNSRVEYV